jgi:predicted ATPase/tRNA A-37 threonylcarbamoyl transferase component Bud32
MPIGGRYEIAEIIGVGGMGTVYRAKDTQTGAIVAIKHLKPEAVANDSSLVQRFTREAEALRQLDHPNIVKVLDTIQEDNTHYLVMELMTGGSLAQKIRENNKFSVEQVLRLALELSDALTRAHHMRIIHRDIKPANVLLADDNTPRLTDFGVARLDSEERMTQSGVAIGTLDYIAPESLNGTLDDPRSDIWSFGVMLFELLTGQRPFVGKNISQVIKSILIDPLPDLELLRPDAPIALVDLIGRMLQKDPTQRIGSIRLVGAELEAILVEYNGGAPVVPRTITETPRQISIRHNLPAETTPFVGREAEMGELRRLVTSQKIRLVSIIAQGGMGKTRLALQLGNDFAGLIDNSDINTEQRTYWRHGVYFVALAPLNNPDDIPQAVADALGYVFKTGEDNKAGLLNFVHDKQLLLILDNVEHVLAGADFVDDLLTHAPHIKIICTSRSRLNLTSENLFTLEGMDFPDWETPEDAQNYSAVKLFMQSAKRARPDFELDSEHLIYVARICRMVQGLPLAILLAAAWVEMLTPKEIAIEIRNSLDFLEGEMRDLPERHRSIRAVFDYSWNLMNETERRAFMNLSVFMGGFTREAAQKAVGASLRVLTSLVNASLIRRSPNSGRYDIHELLRQYAEEWLKSTGHYETIYADYAIYYLGFMADRQADLQGKRQLGALDEIEADFENIRQAWRWAVTNNRADLIAPAMESLHLFGLMRSYQEMGKKLFTFAREQFTVQAHPNLWAKLTVRFPDVDVHINTTYQTCLKIARDCQDQHEEAYCLRMLGVSLAHHDENVDEGIPLLHQSLALFQQLGADFYAAQVMDDMAYAYSIAEDAENHRHYAEACLALRRKIGDVVRTADVIMNLATVTILGGNFRDILTYYGEAEEIYRMTNNRAGLSHAYGLLAHAHYQLGDKELAYEKAKKGYEIASDVRDVEGRIYCANVLAIWNVLYGDMAQGKAYQEIVRGLVSRVYFSLIPIEFVDTMIDFAENRYETIPDFIRFRLNLVKETGRPNAGLATILIHFIMQTEKGLATHIDAERMSSVMAYIYSVQNGSWINHWQRYIQACETLKTKWGAETFEAVWARGNPQTIFEQVQEFSKEVL